MSLYPPRQTLAAGSSNSFGSETRFAKPDLESGTRTPSPTPSEAEALSHAGAFDWKRLKDWRFWIRKEWTWYYLIAIILVTAVALVSLFHEQLVNFLRPAADWMHNLKFGWLIPVGILFVISFPPLFGHEIVGILCGLVWGLWVGFAIVAAGTFLGEVGNFYAFKWCCASRGEKLERTNLFYACLAQVVREGGFKVALIARLSAIPGHFTTAIFSTCGMGIIVFSIAAILSLPKQFITVYLGVILEQSSDGTKVSSKDNIIKYSVLGVTTLITFWAVWYIYSKMGKVKVQVIHQRRKARQGKMTSNSPYNNTNFANTSSSAALNPAGASQPDFRMSRSQFNPHANFNPDSTSEPYQRWDENGNAVGYSGDPNLVVAPKPTRAAGYTGRHSEEDIGYQYPMSEVGRDGRIIIRQHSDDSNSSDHHNEGRAYGAPRVEHSPTENYQNPFEPPPMPTLTQSDPSPRRSPGNQYVQPSSQSQTNGPPPLPSMSPNTAFARTYSPPPPSYHTNALPH